MTEVSKVNDTTVAETGTQEIRKVYGKTELIAKKESIELRLAEVNRLLAVFD